jgi:hypothetical protein
MRGTVPAATPAAGRSAIQTAVIAAMGTYVDGLATGEALSGDSLRKAVATVPGLTKPEAIEVIAAPQDLAPAGDLVDRLATAVAAAGSDPARQRAAIAAVLDANATPAGGRQVDPSLVTSTAPERAEQPPTDADLAAWAFTVSAQVRGEAWSIALDTGPGDIELVAAGGTG